MFSSGSHDPSAVIIISVVILVILFVLLRELMCWYWKINRIVDLLSDIKSGMEPRDVYSCPNCHKQTALSGDFCQSCGKPLPS
jgi:hypothetical protein